MASLVSLTAVLALVPTSLAGPSGKAPMATTAFGYSSFTYRQMSTDRYATPLPSPLSQPTFAPPFSAVSTLLPTAVTYTTYSLNRSATLSDDGVYGQSAYAALWAPYTYTTSPPFTTTVSPTPVASSELVFPPPLPALPTDDAPGLKLPSDFIWGGACSAWQLEGGLQFGGRGPCALDKHGAVGIEPAKNDSNVADMHYFMYKQDIVRLAALGVPYFSFSISWSRVVPFGVVDSPVNTEALEHYEDVINTCLEYGITPMVTLLHYDPPLGAMQNLTAFPDHFFYYAKQVMTRFADRVPHWFTINEANVVRGILSTDWNVYSAQLLANAQVYHWYKEELKGTGKVAVKFANNLGVPLDPGDPTHVEAALRYQEYILGIMANPMFLGQQIPESVLNVTLLNMTALTDEQLSYINGTSDYFAFDPYNAQFAYPPPGGIAACVANSSDPLWPTCVETTSYQSNGWLLGAPANAYPMIDPQYVREQFGYVWNTFRPSGIMVGEFGFPQLSDSLHATKVQQWDLDRSLYYQNFLTQTLHAIHTDGVNVIGAIAWSFIDNNEFGSYANQYGLQTVNRTSGNFERNYKRSFFDYVDFFHNHIAC